MTEVNYTDEMVVVLNELETLNWEGAKTLAETFGKTAQSVVAKFKSIGGTYIAKERKEPVGIINKKVYIKLIEDKLGVTMVSLGNMTKVDLIKLNDVLKEV